MITVISKPWTFLQNWLDKTTMYSVVLYSLSLLVLVSLTFGFFDLVAYPITEQIKTLFVFVGIAYASSLVFSKLFRIPANHYSSIITALILFFLVSPTGIRAELMSAAIIVFIAIVSKYVLVYRGQHLFNAAALSLFIAAIFNVGSGSWWVATMPMLVPTIFLASLVVTKVRKWLPVSVFVCVAFAVFLLEEWRFGNVISETWINFFTLYPVIFMAGFMFTEPFAMPATKQTQVMYATVVGFLFSTALFLPWFIMTPELALLLGNIAAYPFTLKRKLKLEFISMREVAQSTFEFVFKKPAGMHFKAGQYLEWMLPHDKPDSRGVRRYFTIASAPSEEVLLLALKVPENGSSFKKALSKIKPGDIVIASQLAGDFVLPNNVSEKLAFVAGGIGITPFRSHIKEMINRRESRDVTLFYCNNTKAEVAFLDTFAAASEKTKLKQVLVLAKELPSSEYETGYLSSDIIKRQTPDFIERTWYISGPPLMVNSSVKILRTLGVPSSKIIKDFFPGLA